MSVALTRLPKASLVRKVIIIGLDNRMILSNIPYHICAIGSISPRARQKLYVISKFVRNLLVGLNTSDRLG